MPDVVYTANPAYIIFIITLQIPCKVWMSYKITTSHTKIEFSTTIVVILYDIHLDIHTLNLQCIIIIFSFMVKAPKVLR